MKNVMLSGRGDVNSQKITIKIKREIKYIMYLHSKYKTPKKTSIWTFDVFRFFRKDFFYPQKFSSPYAIIGRAGNPRPFNLGGDEAKRAPGCSEWIVYIVYLHMHLSAVAVLLCQ